MNSASRASPALGVLNGVLHMVGGVKYDSVSGRGSGNAEEYVSTDGVTWQLQSGNAIDRPISSAKILVLNGSMYLLGGTDWGGDKAANSARAWQSSGTSWLPIATPLAVNTPIIRPGRSPILQPIFFANFAVLPFASTSFDVSDAIVFNGKMWVQDFDPGTNVNAMYSSSDGSSWTRELAQLPWGSRSGFSMVAVDPPPPPTPMISAGDTWACSLLSSGGVKCWGQSEYLPIDSAVPVDVPGLTAGVAQLASGFAHACVLLSTGGVECWGSNAHGEVGLGMASAPVLRPTPVVGLASGVKQIALGPGNACAVMDSGAVKCWGDPVLVGQANEIPALAPVDVAGLGPGTTSSIALGSDFGCALLLTGGVRCWGAGGSGQLGNNSNADSSSPVDVYGLTSGVAAISAGPNFACAVLVSGALKCWGGNGYGQLGAGPGAPLWSPVPLNVATLSAEVKAVSNAWGRSCALLTGGRLKCWGYNSHGEFGNGSLQSSYTPVSVAALPSAAVAVSAGGSHTCALTDTGAAFCWGWNAHGQLGNGGYMDSLYPVLVK